MAQPKFTPGPWDAERTGTKCWQIHNEHSPIAEVTGAATRIRYPDVDENAANARMIAAAPQMYEALRKAAGVISGETTTKADLIAALEATRAALRKADGHAS